MAGAAWQLAGTYMFAKRSYLEGASALERYSKILLPKQCLDTAECLPLQHAHCSVPNTMLHASRICC